VIEIDRHIPPPPPRKEPMPIPFSAMQIGDSFLAPHRTTARAQANRYKSRHPGWNYTSRTTPEGTRIWRIA
jgi:hypothetical protein